MPRGAPTLTIWLDLGGVSGVLLDDLAMLEVAVRPRAQALGVERTGQRVEVPGRRQHVEVGARPKSKPSALLAGHGRF